MTRRRGVGSPVSHSLPPSVVSLLAARFPALAAIPRADLGVRRTPVQPVEIGGASLWVKRDDLAAERLGGNKVRALQLLLGGVAPGTRVLTLGGEGSTHVLSTAIHAASLGARTWAVRWPHEMNEVAVRVAAAIDAACERAPVLPAPLALLRLLAWRAGAGGVGARRYVPFGGSSPLGVLGHVEAALELAAQVEAGELPEPARVVVPLGTGGTAAGLALGLAAAGLRTTVMAARVGPRLGATRGRALRLAAGARRLARRHGARLPPPAPVRMVHDVYGGAYGRPLPAGESAARHFRERLGVRLDATYAAKAGAAALALARREAGVTLLWITFDGRWLEADDAAARAALAPRP